MAYGNQEDKYIDIFYGLHASDPNISYLHLLNQQHNRESASLHPKASPILPNQTKTIS